MRAWPIFEGEIVTPYGGFACSAMLDNDEAPVRCGGGLFFHRGGCGERPIALRNHAKVFVSEGAPRLGVGCEVWKRLVL